MAFTAIMTHEGKFYRRMHDIKLMRSHYPIFSLTWTLMHEIDEQSPFFEYDAERFKKSSARLFLSIAARDPALEAHVYDTWDYGPEDILFGHLYADAVTIDGSGRTIADLTRISWTEREGNFREQREGQFGSHFYQAAGDAPPPF
jgi:inward rectifier potassium channel